MKNLIIAAVAVTAFTFVTTNSADAGPRGRRTSGYSQFSIGGNGWNVSIGGRGRGYRNNYRNSNLHTRQGYQPTRNNYRPVRSNYQPVHNNYRPVRNNYQSVHTNYRPVRSNYRSNRWDYNLH